MKGQKNPLHLSINCIPDEGYIQADQVNIYSNTTLYLNVNTC